MMNKKISILLLTALFSGISGAELNVETNHPNINTFQENESVIITVTGKKTQTLTGVVLDEFGEERFRFNRTLEKKNEHSASVSFPMPSDQRGFYRIVFTDANGKKAFPAEGSLPEGEITYAVVPSIAKRKLYPIDRTFFGMQGSSGTFSEAIPYMGIRHTVATRFWDQFEPDHPGQFLKKRMEEKAKGRKYPDDTPYGSNAVYSDGGTRKVWKIYPLPSLFRIPQWKNCGAEAGLERNRFAPLSADGEKYFAEYCYQTAKAYREDYPDFSKRYYQVTWEPHYPWGFAGDLKQLIQIYKTAYPAIHRADPDAVVIGPCFAGLKYIDELPPLLEAGLGNWIDAFSHHPYASYPPEAASPIEYTQKLRDMLRKYTGKDLPLLATEQGYQVPALKSELDKARGDIRMALLLLGEGWQCHQTFYLFDYLGEPGYGFYYTRDPKQGWTPTRISPKAGVPAYAALTFLLEGQKSVARIDFLGEGILGYAYEGDQGNTLVLWSWIPGKRSVKIPVGSPEITLFDWMGNGTKIKVPGNHLPLELTEEPVYIRGVSSEIWGKTATRLIEVSAHPAESVPGAEFTVGGAIRNPYSNPLTGILRISSVSGFAVFPAEIPISIPSNARQSFEFPVKIKKNINEGNYQLSLVFNDKTGIFSMTGMTFQIKNPIELSAIHPLYEQGEYHLLLNIKSPEPKDQKVDVSVRIKGVPGTRKKQTVRLFPEKTEQTIKFHFPDASFQPQQRYETEISASLENGLSCKRTAFLNFTRIPFMKQEPEMNGNPDSWNSMEPIFIQGAAAIREPKILKQKSESDLSGIMYSGWNKHALFLMFDVTDDLFNQKMKGWYTWNGDCVQLGIDLDPGKVVQKTGNAFADLQTIHRRQELTLALTESGPKIWRTISFDKKKFPETEVTDMTLKIKRWNATRTLYEIRIPWSALGEKEPPSDGRQIGLAVCIADRDNDKLPISSLGIFDGIKGSKNHDEYGIFTLTKQKDQQ